MITITPSYVEHLPQKKLHLRPMKNKNRRLSVSNFAWDNALEIDQIGLRALDYKKHILCEVEFYLQRIQSRITTQISQSR